MTDWGLLFNPERRRGTSHVIKMAIGDPRLLSQTG